MASRDEAMPDEAMPGDAAPDEAMPDEAVTDEAVPDEAGPGDAAADEPVPDYGLISPLAIPPDSKVPDPATGTSTGTEYDLYFRIVRDDPSLVGWSRTCLRIDQELRSDLDRTGLSAEEKYRIVEGLLAVHRVTLERWVAAAEAAAR